MITQEDLINHTDKNHSASTILQLFSEQLKVTPEAIALIFQDQHLTYQDLDERSNQLAHYLKNRYQLKYGKVLATETLIALILDRSVEMIIAILAIFKAGAAYVPIDPHYPDDRISYILQDINSPLICCQSQYQDKLTMILQQIRLEAQCVVMDENDWIHESLTPLCNMLDKENLAYVIYTSGTTGKPKGVMIEHAALFNRISWMQETYPISSDDRILQKTPYTFDVSVWELLWANLYGASIVIAPPESHKYPEELEQLICEYDVTVLHFVPSMLQSFQDYLAATQKQFAVQLRYVFCSGESLALKTVEQFNNSLDAQSQAQLHNLYGPTETTIDSTFFACSQLNEVHNSVPIGRPIANTLVYILDDKQHRVAVGNTGELYIGGAGLARAYLNKPELTQERFIANPYLTADDELAGYTRLYKTGDMVRQLGDGNIEYLGRNDSQIKLRGLRIELGEVENTISQFFSVKQCVVKVAEHVGQQYLIGYFSADHSIDTEQLNHWLSKQLPEYMLPSLLKQVKSFAVTQNGKLDRTALPEVNFKLLQGQSDQYQAAENSLQELLCHLVGKLLDLPHVGIEDNFFAIGGDSILSIQLAAQLRHSGYLISVREIVSCQTIRQLATFIEAEQSAGQNTEEFMDIHSLAFNPMQQLIISHQLISHEVLYNEHISIDFKTVRVNIEQLNQALIRVINHHLILRCCCDESYKRFIAGPVLDNSAQLVTFHQIADQQAYKRELSLLLNQPFDLQQGPLYRFALFQIGESGYKLAAIFHHLIADGDAMYNLFVPQLKILLKDSQAQLPKATATIQLPPTRQDFQFLLENIHPLNLFAGSNDFTIDKIVSHQNDSVGHFIVEILSLHDTQHLCNLAKQQGVSFYSLLLSVTYLLLYKISDESCLSVGGVKSLRSALSEPVFGNFLANEISCIQIDEKENFVHLLQTVFEGVQQSLLSTLPYDELLQQIRQTSDPLEKLPNIFMTLEPKMARDSQWYVTQNEALPAHVKYELYFEFDLQEQLELRIEYRDKSYSKAQILTLSKILRTIFSNLHENIDVPLECYSLLSEVERNALIYDYNPEEQPYPLQSIQALFSEQAKRYPQATALIQTSSFDIEQVSYAELDMRSNQLAHYLCAIYEQQYGTVIPRGKLIALYFDRSVEMIISILAILKAGGAYVPLDPDYPSERIAYILADTEAEIILTGQSRVTALLEVMNSHQLNGAVLNVEEHSSDWVQAPSTAPVDTGRMDDLAYVIYTSGTTGHPKGVMVEHAAVVSLVKNNDYLLIQPTDCFMQLASPVFDAATLEIWGALLNGSKLVLPSNSKDLLSNLGRFKRQLEEFEVTILWLTKTLFDSLYLSDNTLFQSLRYLLTGGEALDPGLIKALSDHAQGPQFLLNGYGPTETTTFATTYNCHQEFNGSVPIGRAINGRKTYILDKSLNLVAPGLVGELYVGGAGVARGYLNSEQLTRERFLVNPFASQMDTQNGHTRMYKTGDLVRWLDNGNIEYIGRNDSQVKIRGFRIEPGEIEALIKQFPGIVQAVVVAHDWQGHKQLLAYYTKDDAFAIDEEALRESLQQQLPDYMQPAQFIAVGEFKQTLNGKLDYRALPSPSFSGGGYVAPRNEQESQVCDVIAELLNVEQVGIEDDFFRIGGDSILSIQLSSRLRRMDIHLSVKAIFQHKTVKRMLVSAQPQTQMDSEQGLLSGSFALLPVQQWFFTQMESGLLPAYQHWNQCFMLRVPALEPHRLSAILVTLMAHHDMLRTSFSQEIKKETNEVCYQQRYQAQMTAPELQCLDAQGLSSEEVSQALTQWQSHYELFNVAKPLFSVGYVSNYRVEHQVSNYVFFSAHHLIIDAVSWRIIAEDLRSLYAGETLLPKSASYRQWVSAVARYAQQHPTQQAYWSDVLSSEGNSRLPAATDEQRDSKVIFSSLLTQQLLYQANQAYSTEINDLLLTALATALTELSGSVAHLITLEGHGRESIDAKLDVSRTLGWFTTLFPVRLLHETEFSLAIRQTKEMLRTIPDKGIGYGALMLSAEQEHLPPISFNYLGVFNSDSKQQENDWPLADMDGGESMAASNHDNNLININGLVIDGVLQFDVNTRLNQEQLNLFSAAFKAHLENLVSHCVQCIHEGQQQATPSDFYAAISLELFDRLYNDNIEGIYAANSLQQGFIYHALSHAQDDAYRVQILIDYPHAINIERFKRAWEYTLETYPILRTSFNWEESPVQLIHKTTALEFQLHDGSDCSNPQEQIDRIQQQDRSHAFDLSKPSLLRLHLIKHNEQHYTLLKSEHHSIADGWSEPVVLSRVAEYYAALENGEAIKVVADKAYLEAQIYYARHAEESQAYWAQQQQYLSSANDLSSLLSKTVDLDTIRTLSRPQSLELSLSSNSLKQVAKAHGLTLNSMVQFAWHKLINVYSTDEQTIVGTTVSGRAIPIDGIEQSVGLYINTLPLRIDWSKNNSVLTQLQHINQQIAELNNYAFTPLVSLQRQGRRLFHSLLVYENYPMTTADEHSPLRGELRAAIEKVDYPLALIVHEQGEQLHIGLSYDAALMEVARAEYLAEQLQRILEQIPAGLEQPHSRINVLSEAERQLIAKKVKLRAHTVTASTATVNTDSCNGAILPEQPSFEDNATEQWLIQVFTKILACKTVGVLDDFFRLGVNSIVSISILHQINNEFNVDLSYTDFMTNSTIRNLANLINSKIMNEEIYESGEL